MIAAVRGLKDVVEFLIREKADVDAVATESDATPLHLSAFEGYAEIVQLLLKAGADHSICVGERKWAPIHVADRHPECLRALLDGGADIEASSADSTALYIAAYHGNLESVNVLISRGANLEVTCLFPNLVDSNFTPLLAAALQGHYEVIRALLEAGANIKARTPNKKTALHLALSESSEQAIRALLEFDPELDAQDDEGITALCQAIITKKPVSLVKLLVNRGARLGIQGDGFRPLDIAIFQGRTEIAKYLITAKAELNTVGSFWGGPLHAACRVLDFDIVKLLLAKGANVNLVDPQRGTPLQVALLNPAEDSTKQDIIRFLINDASANVTVRGGLLWSALHAACLGGTPESIKMLVEQGAEVEDTDTINRRPIHHATFRTVKHIEQLLSFGVNTQVRDKLGRTVLHTAVGSGRVDVVEKCLSVTTGLVNNPDCDGWTPLLWAVRSCGFCGSDSSNRAAIIELLLARGANLWAIGRHGDQEWSALKLARYYGASKEVISLLTPKEKTIHKKDGKEGAWNALNHSSRKGKYHVRVYCDACLYVRPSMPSLRGFILTGLTKDSCGLTYASKKYPVLTFLCRKCYGRRAELFPDHTQWDMFDVEFDPDSKEEDTDEDKETDDPQTESPAPVKQVQASEADYWSDSD